MCLLLSRYAQNLSPGIMAPQFRLAASSTVIVNRHRQPIAAPVSADFPDAIDD
jgi:hypothetical protein